MSDWQVIEADCVEAMRTMPEASLDAIVTDPPYGLEFMGRDWDKLAVGDRLAPKLTMEAGEPEAGNPWASERTSYGAPKRNPRCRRCGKQKFNHPKSRCSCDAPDWDLEGWHHNYRMQEWHETWAREALRVLKPGGHLLAFGGTRTYHRLACAIEDAGFEIRDRILSLSEGGDAEWKSHPTELAWLYGSGFP